ncbi:MAG: hypothetical protein GC129_05890 [Proteobacteria bacterium]|nr:hypothetical protein [Pseudomonadota bacterium]
MQVKDLMKGIYALARMTLPAKRVPENRRDYHRLTFWGNMHIHVVWGPAGSVTITRDQQGLPSLTIQPEETGWAISGAFTGGRQVAGFTVSPDKPLAEVAEMCFQLGYEPVFTVFLRQVAGEPLWKGFFHVKEARADLAA